LLIDSYEEVDEDGRLPHHWLAAKAHLTPKYISSTPFPTLLQQHLPKQFIDSSIFRTYNTACTFIKHMKYDKAELVEIEDVLKPKAKTLLSLQRFREVDVPNGQVWC